MAFINKIFSIKKKTQKSYDNNTGWSGFNFTDQQVRVILFRECEWQSHKLLFDSSTIKKVALDAAVPHSNTQNVNRSNNLTTLNVGSCPNTIHTRNNSTNSLPETTRCRKISTESTPENLNIPPLSSLTNSVEQILNSPRKKSTDSKSGCDDTQSKTNITNIIETSHGYGYQFNRPSGDTNTLGEMIFGSVALTFRGTCLKIHSLRTDNDSNKNIMCTHVFIPPVRPLRSSVTNRGSQQSSSGTVSSTSDMSTTDSSLKSGSTNSTLGDVVRTDTEGDSGMSIGDQSAANISYTGPTSFRYFNPTTHESQSYLLYESSPNVINTNRRVIRNIATSLDYWPVNTSPSGSFGPNSNSYSSLIHSGSFNDSMCPLNSANDNYRRNSSGTEESLSLSSSSHNRKIKLGLAVIIELTKSQENELEQYLIEHMPIIDCIMWRLRDCVQRAYWRKSAFIPIMMDGSKEAASSIRLLLSSPYSDLPLIWHQEQPSDLSSSSSTSFDDSSKNFNSRATSEINKNDLFWKMFFKTDLPTNFTKRGESDLEKFVRDFCDLLKLLDNKDTNFFLSALITAVLSYHLGWILSIVNRNDCSDSLPVCSALWVQLSEMSGAIGFPAKFAQTVVVGKAQNVIMGVLTILSYFIRYSTVVRKVEIRVDDEKEDEIFNETLQKLRKTKIVAHNKKTVEKMLEKPITMNNNLTENMYEMINFKENILTLNYAKNKTENRKENFLCENCSGKLKVPLSTEVNLNVCTLCKKEIKTNTLVTNNQSNSVNVSTSNSMGCLKRTKTQSSLLKTYEETSFHSDSLLTNPDYQNENFAQKFSLEDIQVEKSVDELEVNKKFNLGETKNQSTVIIKEPPTIIINDRRKSSVEKENVVFVLGENEKLIGIKSKKSGKNDLKLCCKKEINQSLSDEHIPTSQNFDHKYQRCQSVPPLPSSSSSSSYSAECSPTLKCSPKSPCHQRLKKYSGVKFNFEQYPQIATNYMKSKNLDVSNMEFLEKGMKMTDDDLALSFGEFSKMDFPKYNTECKCGFDDYSNVALQTPSNASELESTSDLPQRRQEQYATEKIHNETDICQQQRRFERRKLNGTVIVDNNLKLNNNLNISSTSKNNYISNKNYKSSQSQSEVKRKNSNIKKLDSSSVASTGKKSLVKTDNHPLESLEQSEDNDLNNTEFEHLSQSKHKNVIKLSMIPVPLARSTEISTPIFPPAGYKHSLIKKSQIHEQYMSGVILQGITEPISEWSCALKRDLALSVRHSPIDQPISEAVCILGDVDNWRVQLISSSSMTVSGLTGLPQVQNSSLVGTPISASQLIGDMLETFQELWKCHIPPQQCLQYIEDKLYEIYVKSFAFSELLLATDFCDMEFLTNTLNLHPNDVPLLLSIASIHTPQVAQKYGISFQS